MARLQLNDRTNQLRLTGELQEVFWPRFRPTTAEQWRTLLTIFGQFCFAIFAACFISVTRVFWLSPLFILFPILDSIRSYIRSFHEDHPLDYRQSKSGSLTFTYVWFLAVLLPSALTWIDHRLWTIFTLVVCVFLLMRFAHQLCGHFLYYLTANHRLSAETEAKWRTAFTQIWKFPDVEPVRTDLTDAERTVFQAALRTFQTYVWRFVVLQIVLAGSAVLLWNFHVNASFLLIFLTTFIAIAGLIHSFVDFLRGISHPLTTWLAIQNWLNSPPDVPPSEEASWSARGPYGRTRTRRDTFLAVVATTMALAVALGTSLQFGSTASTASNPVFVAPLQFVEFSSWLARAEFQDIAPQVAAWLCLIPVAPLAMFLLIHWLVGPALSAGHSLFESESSPEHEVREFAGRKSKNSTYDGISSRLLHSPHPELRNCAMIGWTAGAGKYPVLLDDSQWVLGMHVLGAMRSGKTHRFILPLILQRMRQNVGPLIIIDLKGDNVLFQAIRRESQWLGRKFLHFTNVDHYSTYLFNPLLQTNFHNLTVSQFSEIVINALNLWHGFFYGGFHFGSQSIGAFASALRMEKSGDGWVCTPNTPRIETFDELEDRIRRVLKRHPEFGGASSLVMVIREMAHILQINFPSQNSRFPQSAVDAAIQVTNLLVPDANGNFTVLYLFLRTESQIVGASQIAKLLVHAFKNARIQMMDQFKLGRITRQPPIGTLTVDEWQMLADSSIYNLLEQGAGLGVHFLLANQDISQLQRNNGDLLSTVWENCASKAIFTARDPLLQDRIIKVSGEKTVHVPSYQISKESLLRGDVTSDHALTELNGEEVGIMMHETRVPLIERNDLIELSDHPSRFLFIPSMGQGQTQYGGYPIVVESEFVMSAEDYRFLDQLPWPAPTAETVIPADYRDQEPPTPRRRRKKP